MKHLKNPPEDTASQSKGRLSMYLKISVFLTGIGVMSAEMAAPRLLAPHFGTTQVIWTNIIGTVLAALTVGAFVGGKLSDRWPNERIYARILVIGGFLLVLVPFISSPLLHAAGQALSSQKIGVFIFSLIAVCLFFAPPVFFMGMISPWAVKLAGADRKDLGKRAGILSGLSALGSIIGTFSSSLFALPLLGTRKTLLLTGGLLVATGIWRAFGPRKHTASAGSAIVCIILLCIPEGNIKSDRNQIYEDESLYHYVQVVELNSGERRLHLNEGMSIHSKLRPNTVLTDGYWDYISVLPTVNTEKGDPLDVLILGLAGGSMAMQIEHFYNKTRKLSIDGVEIDPGVIKAGRLFFGLDTLNTLTIHVTDARTYLAAADKTYDLIIADAYRHPYIPFHMVTKEFYAQCYSLLKPDGIFAINLGTSEQSTEIIDSFAATMKEAFPFIAVCSTEASWTGIKNFIYMGAPASFNLNRLQEVPDMLRLWVLPEMHRSWKIPAAHEDAIVFTDDRSPIELLTEWTILRTVFKMVSSS